MKRASERQITKDDADTGRLDGDAEQVGSFEKAAPEVLAKRRILKVRRTVPTQSADAPKAPNPFAAISATPVAPAPARPASAEPVPEKPIEAAEKPESEKKSDETAEPVVPSADISNPAETKQPAEAINSDVSKKQHQAENPSENPADIKAPEAPSAETAKENSVGKPEKQEQQPRTADSEKPVESKPEPSADSHPKTDEPAAKDEPAAPEPETKPDQKSESKSAPQATAEASPAEEAVEASTVSAEAGKTNEATAAEPAKSTEPAKSVEPAKSAEPALSAPPAKANGKPFKAPVTFGNLSGGTPLTFANAAAAETGSSFNIQPIAKAPPAAPEPSKEFKEAPVETGEESDEELFRERAKLYNLETPTEGNARWKERGVGILKLNRHKKSNKTRLIMRTEATLKVILNSPIFEGFMFDRATERSLRFLGYDPEDPKKRLTFLVRFSAREGSEQLVAAVKQAQDVTTDANEKA